MSRSCKTLKSKILFYFKKNDDVKFFIGPCHVSKDGLWRDSNAPPRIIGAI
jgi:hypothetical protein